MFDRSPAVWFPQPKYGAGTPEAVHALAYRAAVTGADAYRAVRSALRVEEGVLRVGNRFVALDRYREVGFLAAGNAASSLAFGASDALGERLTQGFVAGPDPLPKEVPFRSVVVPPGLPGSGPGAEATAAALELAGGLGERDLLLVLLSGGALAALTGPPEGLDAPSFHAWLAACRRAGATGEETGLLARAFGGGAAGGRLAARGSGAEVVTLLVDRGDGPAVLGGGPTIPVSVEEARRARATLERLGVSARSPGAAAPPPEPPLRSGERRALERPVVVAAPADALRAAGEAVAEKGYHPRLVQLALPGGPAAAAERFVDGAERLLGESGGAGAGTKGVVLFATTTLDLPEGVDPTGAAGEFLRAASARVRRRGMTVSILATDGHTGSGGAPPGALVGARSGGGTTPARPLAMRPGITDVGLLAVAFVGPAGSESTRPEG